MAQWLDCGLRLGSTVSCRKTAAATPKIATKKARTNPGRSSGYDTISYADVLRREVRLDGIESQGEPVVEHAAEAEAEVVLLASAVQQVVTVAVTERALFPVAPFA
jgi:hypothetical protein